MLSYQNSQQMIEKKLRRGLRARWNDHFGRDAAPGRDTLKEVIAVCRIRSVTGQRLRSVGMALLMLMLLMVSGLVLRWRKLALFPAQPAILHSLVAGHERLDPVSFRGVVAFQPAAFPG